MESRINIESALGLAGLAACLSASPFVPPAAAADEAAAPPVPEYRVDPDFFQIPDGLTLGSVAGVAFTSRGEIFVSHRGARPILVFDGEGRLLRSFGLDLFPGVHGTRVDAEDTIWITDMRVHTVHRFTLEGEELLRLGERGVRGDDERLFNRPTDTAFGRDGTVLFRYDDEVLHGHAGRKRGGAKRTDPHGLAVAAQIDAAGAAPLAIDKDLDLSLFHRHLDQVGAPDIEKPLVRHAVDALLFGRVPHAEGGGIAGPVEKQELHRGLGSVVKTQIPRIRRY